MKTAFHKIKVAFLAVLLSLGMNSCQDWLTIFPEGELILEDYWKEGAHVEQVLRDVPVADRCRCRDLPREPKVGWRQRRREAKQTSA